MIVFDLKCVNGHQFESWFRSSDAYDRQVADGLVECPYCGSIDVKKALMAPNVTAKGNQESTGSTAQFTGPAPVSAGSAAMTNSPELQKLARQAADAMEKLQKHVEQSCENVGDRFAEEARKMHYGESEERGIYGETSLDEAQELLDEGVDIMPLPGVRRTDA